MVALDDEGHPVEVPPLILETEEERRRQEQARLRRQIRNERRVRLGG
jgi:acyl-CoA hydrolase